MTPIDIEKFMLELTILANSCRQPLIQPAIERYYDYFNGKISTEQFCNSAQQLFEQGCDRLPPPVEWVKLARSLTPDLALPPAPEAPAYEDMDDLQKAAYRRKIQQARAVVAESTKQGLAHIGGLMAPIDAQVAAQKKQAQLDKMNGWLGDSLLRKEAIAWAMIQPDVALVQNELGEVSGLRWAAAEEEATA